MAFCEFCKAEGQNTGTCAYCGTVHYTASATFVFGQTEKESYAGECRLTDKYLIVRSVSKTEMIGNVSTGAAFGVIGILAASAVDAARKKNYGFYDLQDLQKVIYPYHTNTLTKNTAFKFINKDGTDLVLNFNLNGLFSEKAAKGFAAALVKIGVYVENGAGMKYSVCCAKPFVNKDTFGVRVCQSAATFVKMTEKQFVAPALGGADEQISYTQPVQQPVAPTAVQEQPAASVQQTDLYKPASRTPAEETKTKQNMCHTCGSMNYENARFCCKCGTQLQIEQDHVPALSVDAWRSKW